MVLKVIKLILTINDIIDIDYHKIIYKYMMVCYLFNEYLSFVKLDGALYLNAPYRSQVSL